VTTYVYEPIHEKAGEKPRHFEIKQSMKEAPLNQHPESGEPRHPGADEGNALSAKKKPEIAVAQGAQDVKFHHNASAESTSSVERTWPMREKIFFTTNSCASAVMLAMASSTKI
jgi:hypothetical protein